jgi:hypothetical protein
MRQRDYCIFKIVKIVQSIKTHKISPPFHNYPVENKNPNRQHKVNNFLIENQ